MQRGLAKARERVVALASKVTIQAVTTEPCAVRGTSEINDDGLDDNGIGVVVFTFRDCAEDNSATLNGVMRMTIAARDLLSLEPSDYTLGFENLRISSGSQSIDANGTSRIVIAGSTVTTTRNTTARYLPENVYVRVQDFVETETVSDAVLGVTFRGRFCQSQHGCVDVQTPVLVNMDDWGIAFAGRMLLTSGAARVELRFREENDLSIAIDTDGDGTVERGMSILHPGALLQPIVNFLPMVDAGPDRNAYRNEIVTLDASGRAWDGSPVSYSWSFVTVPQMGGPVGGGQGTFSFFPTVNGTYVVRLLVTDSSDLSAGDLVTIVVRDAPTPVASAGPTISTFERSTVTLDASNTSYPGGSLDSLQYSWSRTLAPAGSSAPATLTGMHPQVAIDLPGVYEYRLTVTAHGRVSTDTARVIASGVVRASTGNFLVAPYTQLAETTYEMLLNAPPGFTGLPLALTISSDVDWLTIDTPNVTMSTNPTRVPVRLNLEALASLPNGGHDAVVRIAPAGYSEWTGSFHLQVELPNVRQVSPHVVYAGQFTTVNLLGDRLQWADGWVAAGGLSALALTRASPSKARAELPALTSGEYSVSVANALGIERAAARLVVRDPPVHVDSEVTLPARPYSLEYDPERNVFYGVFGTDSFEYFARRFYRLANGTWQFDEIAVPNPRALTLALGGEQLLVTSANCGVYEVDAASLQTVASELQPGCLPADFGLIAALADGAVIFGNTNTSANLRTYPGFNSYPFLANVVPEALLSHDRSRMLWGQSDAGTIQPNLWIFDVLGAPLVGTPTTSLVATNDNSATYGIYSLAISGDGSRFMNYEDVYDNNHQYVGALQGLDNANITSAISRTGTRAVVYNNDTDELMLFDVSAGSSFSSLGVIDTFAEEFSAERITYFPDDTAVFISGAVQTGSPGNESYEYRLFVRELP